MLIIFCSYRLRVRQPSQKHSDGGKLCQKKRDRQTAANHTDPCLDLCSQHPNNPGKHHPFTNGGAETLNKVPIPRGSIKCLLSVFLARSIYKSPAQVHTASYGTFKVLTYSSKAPSFCLACKKALSSHVYLSFPSKLVRKRCQNRLIQHKW